MGSLMYVMYVLDEIFAFAIGMMSRFSPVQDQSFGKCKAYTQIPQENKGIYAYESL